MSVIIYFVKVFQLFLNLFFQFWIIFQWDLSSIELFYDLFIFLFYFHLNLNKQL